MAEGIRRAGETRPHGADVPEGVLVDHTDGETGETLASPRPSAATRPSHPTSAPSIPMPRPVYKRPLWLVVASACLIIAALVGVHYYQYMVAHVWTDDAFIEGRVILLSPKVTGHILQVYVTDNQEVQQGDLLLEIDPRDYAARLTQAQAVLQATIAKQQTAQTNVALIHVTADAGMQQATAGVELAKAAVQTARAQVVTMRSRLEQARAQVDTALANAAQAHVQVSAADAEVTRADADVKRTQQLFGSDQIVSRQSLDHAIKDTRVANAQLEAARKKALASDAQVAEARAAQQTAIESLRQMESQVLEAEARVSEALGRLTAANAAPHQVAMSQSQVETSNAEVAQARAAVERAELELAATKIYAPESGRVTRKVGEAGAYVQIGQALLAIVPREVWVVANFMETQLTHMRPGQPVEIQVDAYPGKVFMGHVESIQAGTGARFSLLPPENATGNFVKVVQRVPVKIVFDAPPEQGYLLSPGMSVVPVVKVQ